MDTSKSLSPHHQLEVDSDLKLNRNAAALKEPFSREVRAKMASKQKHLPGNAKHMKSVGSLKKAEFELLGHWAAGTVPIPIPKEEKPIPKKPTTYSKKEAKPKKDKKSSKRKKSEGKEKDDQVEKKVKKTKGKENTNGYKKVSDGKLSELDQVRFQLAQVPIDNINILRFSNTNIFTSAGSK